MKALRKCKVCSGEAYTREDLEEFKIDSKGKYGRANFHKGCVIDYKKKWREENPEENKVLVKRAQVKKTYGVSLEYYEGCMETSPVCESCGRDHNLVYDHSHITGEFRGVLCGQCNTAAGMMKDKAEEVYRLYKYLVDRGD